MEASTMSVATLAMGEEVKPYRIHVSSKYLDLTRKKLELTRLPHELELCEGGGEEREWAMGTPKSEIEPLTDYWLETYAWRAREDDFNATLPQYRTSIQTSLGTSSPLRIHFLHLRSSHASAIPLLLIPAFPLTNLSLPPSLWTPLLEPQDGQQAFHIAVPSIPGLGFSDAFTNPSQSHLAETAEIFNTLMLRLGYETYLATGTGSGVDSPAEIDHYLPLLIAENWKGSCAGAHLIAPPLRRPSWGSWAWGKFWLARFWGSGWGYERADFEALRASSRRERERERERKAVKGLNMREVGFGVVGTLGLREPTTLAYALCDSPVGLLSLVASALRKRSSKHSLGMQQVVDICQLAWLPGPEAGMRFWSQAVGEVENLKAGKRGERARIAVSVFEKEDDYVCPAWANEDHELLWSQRFEGQAGLVAWERGQVVVDGVRGLAEEVKKVLSRLRVPALKSVVVTSEETVVEEGGLQSEVESPDTVIAVSLS